MFIGTQPVWTHTIVSLHWRHNGHDRVSNHLPHDCLLNRLFGRRLKETSKLRVTGLCVGNSQGTGAFPAQMASNAGNVSIWWRHHVPAWLNNLYDTLQNDAKALRFMWFVAVSDWLVISLLFRVTSLTSLRPYNLQQNQMIQNYKRYLRHLTNIHHKSEIFCRRQLVFNSVWYRSSPLWCTKIPFYDSIRVTS